MSCNRTERRSWTKSRKMVVSETAIDLKKKKAANNIPGLPAIDTCHQRWPRINKAPRHITAYTIAHKDKTETWYKRRAGPTLNGTETSSPSSPSRPSGPHVPCAFLTTAASSKAPFSATSPRIAAGSEAWRTRTVWFVRRSPATSLSWSDRTAGAGGTHRMDGPDRAGARWSAGDHMLWGVVGKSARLATIF
jgi:hypothetical protein